MNLSLNFFFVLEYEKMIKIFQPSPVALVFVFHKPFFLISDPSIVQQITGNNFSERPYPIDLLQSPYGIGTAHCKYFMLIFNGKNSI